MTKDAPLFLQLAGVILFWGLAFAAIKQVTNEGVHWVSLTVIRFSLASAVFAVYLAVNKGARVRIAPGDLKAIVAFGALAFTGYHFFLNYGEANGARSGSAALVIATAPAFMVVLAVVHLKERLTSIRVLGLAIAFAGLAMMILLNPVSLQFGLSPALAAIVPAAVMAALYSVYGKPYLKKYPPVTFAAYTMFAGTALMLPVAVLYGPGTVTDALVLSPFGWGALLFLAALPGVVAYVLWFRILDRIPASRAAPYIYLSTLVALIGGLPLGEPITETIGLGAAMVIGGVYLAQRTWPGPLPPSDKPTN